MTITPTEDRRVSPKEYAAMRQCTVEHLANERSRGQGIPYIKYGGRVVYLMSDILADEARRTVVPVNASGGNGGLL